MDDLKEIFLKAVKEAQDPLNDQSKMKNMQKLELYAFFKQATEGACKEDPPVDSDSVFSKTKYNFWKKLGDLQKEDAMKEYIIRVKQFYPEFEKKLYKSQKGPKL